MCLVLNPPPLPPPPTPPARKAYTHPRTHTRFQNHPKQNGAKKTEKKQNREKLHEKEPPDLKFASKHAHKKSLEDGGRKIEQQSFCRQREFQHPSRQPDTM